MDTEGRQIGHSRWSYARDLGDARLVVIDSRAGRDVDARAARELVQDEEWAVDPRAGPQPARHLLLASSVPFLLAPGLHHVEALDEALAEGAWGALGAVLGERLRRLAVMDHWASFQRTFRALRRAASTTSRTGATGDAPASIVLLSGDVHHCYLAEVGVPGRRRPARAGLAGRLLGVSQGARAARARDRSRSATAPRRAPGAAPGARRRRRRRCRSAGASSSARPTRIRSRRCTLDGDHARVASRRSPTATGATRASRSRSATRSPRPQAPPARHTPTARPRCRS